MVGIICFWDELATPYLEKYEKVLNECKVQYEIIFWNRTPRKDAELLSADRNKIFINYNCEQGFPRKMISFLKWKSVIKEVIIERKYEHLIVLSTMPAVLLFSVLCGRYRNNFVFDIRDYTLEANRFFKMIVTKLVNCSSMTAISSKGYYRWLDESDKIFVNHNITFDNDPGFNTPVFDNRKSYNFSFVGNVRLDSQTKALLLTLKNDPRFQQYFHGRILPDCEIESIQRQYGFNNLYLTGPFTINDKVKIFSNTDLINCVYANARLEERISFGDSTPLPNRLYDALFFKRPMVASKGTYLAELIEEYSLGCCINGFDPNAGDKIIEYINSFDSIKFMDGCNRLLRIVKEEEKRYLSVLCATVRKWN